MSNSINQLSVLILAGGKSSRMGQDKALIEINHQPLIQRVCNVAIKVSPAVYILTPWQDRYQAIVPAECQFISESQPNQGPLVALSEGISVLNTEWTLLLGCDLPCLDSTILQQWIHQLAQLPLSTLAMIPYRDSRWEPLCGFYRRQCQDNLQSFIQQGGRSFQQWLPQIEVCPIQLNPPQDLMLLNCNTPMELEKIRQLKGKQR
ncbi:MAG: molybdenum cofactor guanylyltransferase [Microcoleaceae cyanobacterium]